MDICCLLALLWLQWQRGGGKSDPLDTYSISGLKETAQALCVIPLWNTKSSNTSLTGPQKLIWCLGGEGRRELRYHVSSVCRMLWNRSLLCLIIISTPFSASPHTPRLPTGAWRQRHQDTKHRKGVKVESKRWCRCSIREQIWPKPKKKVLLSWL